MTSTVQTVRRIVAAGDGEPIVAQLLAADEPCLVEGAAADWSALTRWSHEYFREKFGSRTVPVFTSMTRIFSPSAGERYPFRCEPMTVAEYLDRIGRASTGPPFHYMATVAVGQMFPELLRELPFRELVGGSDLPTPFIWLSAAGTITPLHFDPFDTHNIQVQIRGTKRWLLFAPEEGDNLYPYPASTTIPQFSQVDLPAVDLEAFPRAAHAARLEVVVGPGDALYMPPRWWHWVESITDSMSVNLWWHAAPA